MQFLHQVQGGRMDQFLSLNAGCILGIDQRKVCLHGIRPATGKGQDIGHDFAVAASGKRLLVLQSGQGEAEDVRRPDR